MKTVKQLSILTSLAAVSLLSGCDIAEDTCTTDADCDTAAGEICANIDEATSEGTCEAPADGSGSGSGSGEETCTTDPTICTAEQQCDDGACVAIVYQHVAIVSRAVENVNNAGNTPGPDLDAVAIKSGGVSSFAASVAKVIAGRASDPEGNVNAVASAITGPNDAMTDTTGGTCNLAEGAGFLSLGYGDGPQGIGSGFCSNVSVVREDSFDVYVGPLVVDLNAITDLTTLVGQGFKLAGSQTAQTGGIFEFAAP
jgi:hypothetical protein